MQITFFSSENLCPFTNSFSLSKSGSHLEPGQRSWSQVSSSTGCHPKCRLELLCHPPLIIHVRIARQMAGWKTKNNNFYTMESELWRNAGPSEFQLQETMLKSYKIWCAYLVVRLWTFWMLLVYFVTEGRANFSDCGSLTSHVQQNKLKFCK